MAQNRLARPIAAWQMLTPGMSVYYEATWIKNQRKNPNNPVTAAETINIFISYKIYKIFIVSKNEKQIFKAQKTLILSC